MMTKGKLEGKNRVIISNISPTIDCGAFPTKCVIHDEVEIYCDLFADGHDELNACLQFRPINQNTWQHVQLQFLGNDQWTGKFKVDQLGYYEYQIHGWVDPILTWHKQIYIKLMAKEDIHNEVLIGIQYLQTAIKKSRSPKKLQLKNWLNQFEKSENLAAILAEADFKTNLLKYISPEIVSSSNIFTISVERKKAFFGAWYEIFPRSLSQANGHGTLQDLIAHLPYLKELGFDIIYLPPIHPIGKTFRKGKNNTLPADPADPGSPWAIGDKHGGHCAIHPLLGTFQDFQALIHTAQTLELEIALDFALQCSPDHPFLEEHPEWFKMRPDGTLQYAENPPKKYQDIYPFYFETDHWQSLWQASLNILLFWIEHGVKIFRVDNPHTKPFRFWQWLIKQVKTQHPEVIFLSEAFTRPAVMYHLAKVGFTQSYTYFTWRNTKQELIDYFNELKSEPLRHFFWPNLWPNTPDILSPYLQAGGTPAFITRLILAATLGSNYGIYGPVFEQCLNTPLKPGGEEYRDSEKYEIKHWDKEKNVLRPLITQINKIRRLHKALYDFANLSFHKTDNDQLLCYSKCDASFHDIIIVVVNLDYRFFQSGWVDISVEDLGIKGSHYKVHDLLTNEVYVWQRHNFVALDPNKMPAHILHVRMTE